MQRLQNTTLALLRTERASEADKSTAAAVISFYPEFGGNDKEPTAPFELRSSAQNGVISFDAFAAAKRAICGDRDIIEHIRQCGLKGRGGSEYPLYLKWDTVRQQSSDDKWLICNCAEGEPGTGKDHALLLHNPHAVVAGMVICAHAVGASKGLVYIRNGYDDAEKSLRAAIDDAVDRGLLGSGGFELEIFKGAGCYVCGEESGALECIEGRRGEPRLKPPYPGVAGLFGAPTVINNCESFADAALAFSCNADMSLRLFTVSGCVEKPGVYELPEDSTLDEILKTAGGKKAAFAQLGGGASGTFVEGSDFGVSLKKLKADKGCSAGTGAVIFYECRDEIIVAASNSVGFLSEQSCGNCVPCRLGLRRCADILEELARGNCCENDLRELKSLSPYLSDNARCGLGQGAANTLKSALMVFGKEFASLVKEDEQWQS